MFAEWRFTRTEIYITEETLIPTPPAKPLQEPNDQAYHNHQVECDEKVQALKKEQADLNLERNNLFREMNEDRPGKGSGYGKEFREHTQELNKWKKEKRDVYSIRETKDNQIGEL